MTPHQLFRETTARARSWPPYAWAIVGGAAVAMFVAVVLFAWQMHVVRVSHLVKGSCICEPDRGAAR